MDRIKDLKNSIYKFITDDIKSNGGHVKDFDLDNMNLELKKARNEYNDIDFDLLKTNYEYRKTQGQKNKTNFSNHRRDRSGRALYFYYRLCSFCQRKFYEHAHDIHLCLCDHPCFDLGIQFYLQTDQEGFRRERYCRALKNQHLTKFSVGC